MSEIIRISDQAAAKVWQLIQEEGKPSLKLRAYVTGGGCSGLQYGFTFTETVDATDVVVAKSVSDSEIQVVVDSMLSLPYLQGAEIDYKNDLEGEQFIIRNPNAKTTCGCGSSFTAEEK
ncbi:MAG TPA: iron-sulfur cluster insertion protein ErpA [Gammaproteobacteria bacterium]|nr:iron-sulfur cluster insertion protein ErpA [Gammaproteobacteria bacterium]